MSIFPTRILVATDGSEEAKLALTTSADLREHVLLKSPVRENDLVTLLRLRRAGGEHVPLPGPPSP